MNTQTMLLALDCPFPSRISEYVLAVEDHTNQWADIFEIYKTHENRYKSALFGHMTCRFYPTASFERLCILNDLLSLLFVVDDIFDHEEGFETSARPIRLEKFAEKFLGIIKYNESCNKEDGAILNAIYDVWWRLQDNSTAEWQAKFMSDIHLLFTGIAWQRENIKNGIVPNFNEFKKWRPLFGGAHLAATLIFFAQNTQTNLHKFLRGPLANLTNRCGHLGCWANDILSFQKEKDHGDTHNLVTILQHQYNISVPKSELKAIEIHNHDMMEFKEVYEDLYSSGIERGYISDLSNILRGNLDWSRESSRYESEFNFV